MDAGLCYAAAAVDREQADLEVVAGQVVDFVVQRSMLHHLAQQLVWRGSLIFLRLVFLGPRLWRDWLPAQALML